MLKPRTLKDTLAAANTRYHEEPPPKLALIYDTSSDAWAMLDCADITEIAQFYQLEHIRVVGHLSQTAIQTIESHPNLDNIEMWISDWIDQNHDNKDLMDLVELPANVPHEPITPPDNEDVPE